MAEPETPAALWIEGLRRALAREAATRPKASKFLKYGTAGFRDKWEMLTSAFFRVGLLAALRSASTSGAVGVMVTASHNKVQDNGVKIIDPSGGMLKSSWEGYAMALANAETLDDLLAELGRICEAEGLSTQAPAAMQAAEVLLGRDTRPHSPELTLCVAEGASLLGARVQSMGLLSTPQLHTIVRNRNTHLLVETGLGGTLFGKPSWASEDGYFRMLTEAFHRLLSTSSTGAAPMAVLVDCAGGVGGHKMAALQDYLADYSAAYGAAYTLTNLPGQEGLELNDDCGAEYVQKQRLPPQGISAEEHRGVTVASLDGDADRIVFHYHDDDGAWHLLDGDKIATLIAEFIVDEMRAAGLAPTGVSGTEGISFGCVQTAYANGASCIYLEGQGVPLKKAKTGVKYCHHAAEEFDIGCYFEANGHGTVIFSEKAGRTLESLRAELDLQPRDRRALAVDRLLLVRQLINQTVGDAISDLLAVQAILAVKGWSVGDWDAVYADLPSRQNKLAVEDRSLVKPNADETRVLEPAALQAAIDAAVAKYTTGRAFVRPSGTEDVVRIYAEAATVEQADQLAADVAQAIRENVGSGSA